MNRETLYEPFSIAFETLDEYPNRDQKHTFFELVYILAGTGTHCINENKFNYYAGHMFLLTPKDCHTFHIGTTTQFFFLRFNNVYIKSHQIRKENIQHLELILNNANQEPGCILKNQTDKCLVKPLAEALLRELINRDMYNQELIEQLVNTLIVIVARNIAKYLPKGVNENTDEKAQDILHYIQSNIYNPEKIKANAIAKQFGVSENYLGKYFKKHTNETMQQYITNYKTRLIEVRLQRSDLRMVEIADEFGFTDESHLNKFFKNQKGMGPREFRNNNKGMSLSKKIK